MGMFDGASASSLEGSTAEIARWLAASDGRSTWATEDLSKAMTIADHHHGYSPIFGSGGFRRRVNMLAKTDDLTRILLWYTR